MELRCWFICCLLHCCRSVTFSVVVVVMCGLSVPQIIVNCYYKLPVNFWSYVAVVIPCVIVAVDYLIIISSSIISICIIID